jgi:hypothetical protein
MSSDAANMRRTDGPRRAAPAGSVAMNRRPRSQAPSRFPAEMASPSVTSTAVPGASVNAIAVPHSDVAVLSPIETSGDRASKIAYDACAAT